MMSHQDIITLKLQMGIDPSVQIAPGVLVAMWQQLNLESAQAQNEQSRSNIYPDHLIATPIEG